MKLFQIPVVLNTILLASMTIAVPIHETRMNDTTSITTSLQPRKHDENILVSPDHDTWCKSSAKSPPFNTLTFNRTLAQYYRAFGSGQGILHEGPGAGPTYRGVCCEDFCLYAARGWVGGGSTSWTDEEFESAVEQIRKAGPGRGGCGTALAGRGTLLFLDYMHKWTDIVVHGYGGAGGGKDEKVRVGDEFGDTCAGAEPYRGIRD